MALRLNSQGYRIGLLLCVVLLAACSKRVALKEEFPIPVMEKVATDVSLYLAPELRNHVHKEELKDGPDWTVEFGRANVELFTQVTRGMFRRVSAVPTKMAAKGTNALLIPTMKAFQLSTPQQSASDYFEVWIKYTLALYAPDGKLIEEWPFTAYGRNRSEFLGGESAMVEATRRAMRDAAAAVVVDFMEQPKVKDYFSGFPRGDS